MTSAPVGWRRLVARLSFLLLPLGGVGLLGVAGIGIAALSRSRQLPRLCGRTLPFVLPAAIWLVAHGLFSSPTFAGIIWPVLFGLFVLLAPAVVLLAIEIVGSVDAARFLVFGGVGLALSVAGDAVFKWHDIPVGVMLAPSLHNWVGAVLAALSILTLDARLLALPVRRIGLLYALLCVGLLASWSWDATFAFVTAMIVLLVGRPGKWPARFGGMSLAAVVVLGLVLASRVVSPSPLPALGAILSHRIEIFVAGLRLAAMHPLLGWTSGQQLHSGLEPALGAAFGAVPLLPSDVSLSHLHNLLVQVLYGYGSIGAAALMTYLVGIATFGKASPNAYARTAFIALVLAQTFDITVTFSPDALIMLTLALLVRSGGSSGFRDK